MKRILVLITLNISFAITVSAQLHFPEREALFGEFNQSNDAARICLATAGPSEAPICITSKGFDFNNGPPGETSYKNHTYGFGYNANFNGTKVAPGLVNFFVSFESKFRNGQAGQPGPPFMSEFHFNWESPDSTVSVRPFGFTIQYDTGNMDLDLHGMMRFFRHKSNGGALWGLWWDTGFLDLRNAPEGRIAFKNGQMGVMWANATGSNTIAPLLVDNQNRVVVGGGQQETLVNSTKLTYTSTVNRGSKQILGAQCLAVPDSDGTQADDTRAINGLLGCLRTHGLLAQ